MALSPSTYISNEHTFIASFIFMCRPEVRCSEYQVWRGHLWENVPSFSDSAVYVLSVQKTELETTVDIKSGILAHPRENS